MATISSHVLDAVGGSHASGIRIACYRIASDDSRSRLFDLAASDEGRIQQQVDTDDTDSQYELLFYSGEYFRDLNSHKEDSVQIVDTVVVRISMPDPNGNYHIPIMLSPHSYSVWWPALPIDKPL